jgi:hypothetical protein
MRHSGAGTGAVHNIKIGCRYGVNIGRRLTLKPITPETGSIFHAETHFEQEITVDLPAATQFLSPRLFMNTGATPAAVAYDCAGVYLKTDF